MEDFAVKFGHAAFGPPRRQYSDIKDQAAGKGYCSIHGQECEIDEDDPSPIHVYSISPPCQGFTCQRNGLGNHIRTGTGEYCLLNIWDLEWPADGVWGAEERLPQNPSRNLWLERNS